MEQNEADQRSSAGIKNRKGKTETAERCNNDGSLGTGGRERELINYEAHAAHAGQRKRQRPGLTSELENHKGKRSSQRRPPVSAVILQYHEPRFTAARRKIYGESKRCRAGPIIKIHWFI